MGESSQLAARRIEIAREFREVAGGPVDDALPELPFLARITGAGARGMECRECARGLGVARVHDECGARE